MEPKRDEITADTFIPLGTAVRAGLLLLGAIVICVPAFIWAGKIEERTRNLPEMREDIAAIKSRLGIQESPISSAEKPVKLP